VRVSRPAVSRDPEQAENVSAPASRATVATFREVNREVT
jgi:hypothetical protein